MSRRRFFVDEVRGGKAQIEGGDAHHLTRVLRVEPGQKYEISDNRNVYLAEIETARKDLVLFSIVDRIEPEAPLVRTIVFASLIRFERFETMLEKATELGVTRVVPVQAERSEKGLDRAALKRMPRWQRIVREASEQSRRNFLPNLSEPVRLHQIEAIEGQRMLLDEDASASPILRALPPLKERAVSVAVLAGPEGGWTDREREFLISEGWGPVSVGPSILRAETSVLAALAIVNAAWQEQAS